MLLDERDTNERPGRREREILVYTERKRTSEWEGGGKRKRETEYECVCTIAVRDPLAFQNRFLAVVTRNAVTPSKYTRSGPVLSPLVAPYSRGRFSRSNQRCVSPSQFSVTLEERPSKGENCSIIIRFPFSLFSYLYIIPPLWHNTVHRSRKVGENRRVCITNAPNMSLLQ